MAIFCMCIARAVEREDSEAGRPGTLSDTARGYVLPEIPMRVLHNGFAQFLADEPNMDGEVGPPFGEHYPNIDIMTCDLCHTVIARDG